MKHSVVLFLSPILIQDKKTEKQDNFVHKQYTNIIDGQEVDCIQTNESAVRYIHARLEEEGSISKIENLICAIEAKHWEHITVMYELKDIGNASVREQGV